MRLIASIVLFVLMFRGIAAGAGLFSETVRSGQMPFKFWAADTNAASAKCIAPEGVVRVDVTKAGEWSCNMPEVIVKPGNTVTISAVVAGEGRGAVFDFEDSLPSLISLGAYGRDADGNVVSWEIADGPDAAHFTGGNWRVFTRTFKVPDKVTAITPRVYGVQPGVFLIGDITVAAQPETLSPDSVVRILGRNPARVHIIECKADHDYYFYRYPSPVKVVFTSKNGLSGCYYKCRVVDAYGNQVALLRERIEDGVIYKPDKPGYYEFHIESVLEDQTNKENIIYRARVCFSSIMETPKLPAGSHPFGSALNVEVAHNIGACWMRKGIFHNNFAYFDVPIDKAQIAAERFIMQSYGLMGFPLMKNLRPYTNNLRQPDEPDSWDNSGLPKDLEVFTEDYRTLASLENNFITCFEFDNEANIKINSYPWYNLRNYTNALIAANKGIKMANPNARMAVNTAAVDINFLKLIHENGGKDSYEIFSIHPYCGYASGYPESPEEGRMLERCCGAREWLDANDKRDCELWTTEFGWHTGSAPGRISELKQAQYIVRGSLLQLAGGVSKLLPFLDVDVPGWGEIDGRMGLTRTNRMPKPAFTAYAVLARTVGALPYRGRMDLGKDIAAFVFADDKKTIVAIWTPSGNKTYRMNLPGDAVRIAMFGDRTLCPRGAFVSVCDDSVHYLEIEKGYPVSVRNFGCKFIPGWARNVFTSDSYRDRVLRIPLKTEADAPVIDGKLDNKMQGAEIDFSDSVYRYSTKMRFLLTPKALYVAARVVGDFMGKNTNKPRDLWASNSLEIYWSTSEKDRPVGYYRKGIDYHLLVAPGDDGTNGKFGDISERYAETPENSPVDVKYSSIATGGYELEARIPLEYLNSANLRPGDVFGFDVQLDVSDRTGSL
ncbi:MAG: hypothetical protein N3B12_04785 [Armatimonadetes bacterium]|nr:hypothetical protein [Armatimonadota bacterium]